RFLVDRLLHLRARGAWIGLRIVLLELDLAAEDAALGVDLIDRHQGAVAEVGRRHRAGAGQFADEGEMQRTRLRERAARKGNGERGGKQGLLHSILPDGLRIGYFGQLYFGSLRLAMTASNAAPTRSREASSPVNSRKASAAW